MFCFRYMEPGVIAILGGVLPFGSIFIEMCVWNFVYFIYIWPVIQIFPKWLHGLIDNTVTYDALPAVYYYEFPTFDSYQC